MNLHMFADDIVGADAKIALLAAISFVLRRAAEHRAGMNLVAFADLGPTHQAGVRHHASAASNGHLALDHHVGADFDIRVDLGFAIDNRGWMNRHEKSR